MHNHSRSNPNNNLLEILKKYYKTVRTHSNKCNNKVHSKGGKISLKEKDSLIIKRIIQWISKIRHQIKAMAEVPHHQHKTRAKIHKIW